MNIKTVTPEETIKIGSVVNYVPTTDPNKEYGGYTYMMMDFGVWENLIKYPLRPVVVLNSNVCFGNNVNGKWELVKI